jgi:hypothetical protein
VQLLVLHPGIFYLVLELIKQENQYIDVVTKSKKMFLNLVLEPVTLATLIFLMMVLQSTNLPLQVGFFIRNAAL